MKKVNNFLDSKDMLLGEVISEKAKIINKRILSTENINIVTIELVKSGERLEFELDINKYDLLNEVDEGTVSYQDNKFIKFEA